MSLLKILSPSEQVAAHLQEELQQGRWTGTMPGVPTLATELGLDRKTVDAALRQLDQEGVLVPQGPGRRRRIATQKNLREPRSQRIAILTYDPMEQSESFIVELQHLLTEAGHDAFFVSQSLQELGMDVKRVARVVKKTVADSWVVIGGSREVLEWFALGGKPTYALAGRRHGVPIAGGGPDKVPAVAAVARRLTGLGHRRIVLMARAERRLPEPGATERTFLNELQAHGISVGPFNLPDWEESIEGFRRGLGGLFATTPPTAVITQEAPLFIAAQQFLAQRGLKVPQDVSLVCTDADRAFSWCHPAVSHIRWDTRPLMRHLIQWANNLQRGKQDTRDLESNAEFVEGGTVGPPPSV